MPSPLEAAGASIQPVSAAPLHTNEFFTGLWSNGSPLGPGAVPYLYSKFYSAARFDRLIDGNDTEISPRLTLIRRPGQSVYNAGPFPPINRFFEFRGFTATDEVIRLLADCDAGTGSATPTVREVTQPNTNKILWHKNAAAGRTSFVSVGNIVYAGDGYATHQWITSAQSWAANTSYNDGDFIIDSNGNIQEAVGTQTGNLANIQIEASGAQFKTTIFLSPATPLHIVNNIYLRFAGLTTCPFFNGLSIAMQVISDTQFWWLTTGTLPITPYSSETGTVVTAVGPTGATPPVWQIALGAITPDGGQQWVNKGPAVMPWGAAGPTTAPVVTTVAAPSIYPTHQVDTWYAPGGSFIIVDPNSNLQQLVVGGITGAAIPASWGNTVGALTADGSCQWKCVGSNAWIASHHYAVGQSVLVTYTYYITVPVTVNLDGTWVTYYQQQAVTATSVMQCAVAGNSGTTQPAWNNGTGTTTTDFQITWRNTGPAATTGAPWPGATQKLSTAVKVIDEAGYIESPTVQAKTAPTAPTDWATDTGASTTDGAQVWINGGPFAVAGTEPWYWAYSGKNSITEEISNASPLSAPLIPSAGQVPVIQGQGLPNPLWDTIVLWRTAAGGSTLLYDDEFPNPGPGATWIYTDTNLDPGAVGGSSNGVLDETTTAPISNQNDPPPANFLPEAYYLGRIWGYVNNQLRWSGGPDTLTGSGNSTFPAVNEFRFPAKGVLCWPTSIGLICYTTCDIWAVLGKGTPDSPFYVVNFQAGIGMASSDAFGVNGSTAYAMLTSHQVVSMDPGAGELEVGFPIADVFDNFYDPKLAYVTWHQGRSADTALYVANGNGFWYRMSAVSAPESGNVWSTAAVIRSPGKVRAMISAEITPGEKVLLLGPHVDGNPILKRDSTTNADNGVAYPAHALIAAVVLAQPGTTAGFQFVVTEEKLIPGATPLTVRILFDEITFSPQIHSSDFHTLRNITNDPPNLPRAKSVLAQRHWALQDPSTVIKCRYYEQDIVWAAENYANELWTNTVYGRLPEKARK